jgi:hypothetical protein
MVHNHIYEMARARKMMGDVVTAHKSYEDFLTLWKDADPDVYQQASRVRQTAQELGDSFQAKPTARLISSTSNLAKQPVSPHKIHKRLPIIKRLE